MQGDGSLECKRALAVPAMLNRLEKNERGWHFHLYMRPVILRLFRYLVVTVSTGEAVQSAANVTLTNAVSVARSCTDTLLKRLHFKAGRDHK